MPGEGGSPVTDRKIVELFWERSQEGVEEVRQKYGSRLLRLADNLLGNSRDAEECVNDTLLAAWQSIPPERPSPLLPWLYAVVRNLALNRVRVNRALKRGGGQFDQAWDELEQDVAGESTEQAVDRRELVRVLNRFLGRLSGRDLTVFMGRYHYGESYAEIAGRLGCSQEAAKMRAVRLRKKLKIYLQKEGVLDDDDI